jgi:hypothetical protein
MKDFGWRKNTRTDSSCGDYAICERRKEIIQAALVFKE